MKRFSNTLLKLASAGAIGLCIATPAHAFPDRLSEQEVLKVELAAMLPATELSVALFIPASCAGVEVSLLCQQFKAFTPRSDDKFSYAAVEGVDRLKSIAGQVAALPAAVRERRFVMLVDWTYSTQRAKSWDYLYLNGEVAVYDQRERKVVWHAIALQSNMKSEQSFAKAASDYIIYEAVMDALIYGRIIEGTQAKGFGMQSVASAPAPGAGSLVIFNERSKFGDKPGTNSVIVSVEPLPKQPKVYPFSVTLPIGSYLALSVPPGKYRINHAHKAEIEVDVVAQQRRAYELSFGLYNSSRISEATGEDLAKLSATSRNFLLPDSVARNRYTGALAWADIAPGDAPVATATPEPAQAAAAADTAGVPAPRQAHRADRPTARIRFLGKLGTKIDFYENRMCFRGSAKGTDVSGADGAPWGWLKGKNESISVGMPDTETTRAIKATPKERRYYREFELPVGKPVAVGMSDSYTYGPNNSGTASCTSGRSFIPVAGADYEARFEWSNGGCMTKISEISVEQDQVREIPVELARVPECR